MTMFFLSTLHFLNLFSDLNLGDTAVLTVTERNELFQRGLEYERNDQPNFALQCYLGCINGLKNKSFFVLLPQCLHNVSFFFFFFLNFSIFVAIFYQKCLSVVIDRKEPGMLIDSKNHNIKD